MLLLSRYVLLRYLLHLAFITALMVGLYAAVDTPERLGQGGTSLLARVPLMLAHVLPVAAGAALLSAFQRLRSSGALVTLRASGVSWRSILSPALAAGLAVAAIEAAISLSASPAALAAVSISPPSPRPDWVVRDGAILHAGPEGSLMAWTPGAGEAVPVEEATILEDLEALARRRPVEETSTLALVDIARLEERLGHDPRPERVEVWTRLLLPCALLLVLVTCAVSVKREHPPWRAVLRLVIAFTAGWLCLAAATQLFLSGVLPAWSMLALPVAALLVCALL
ncbi:MAG: LptF/LptG family permease [Deltaproteobacteria bacterium]|nr:LptF/LptG family permease [Deltaproteobacteria bacterium]